MKEDGVCQGGGPRLPFPAEKALFDKMKKVIAFFREVYHNTNCPSGCGSVWLERSAGGREVAGSNPVTPTDPENRWIREPGA